MQFNAFSRYTEEYIYNRTKNSIFFGDTSHPTLACPASGEWQTLCLNGRGWELPDIGHAKLRVWLMLGTPTSIYDIANIGVAFRAPGDTAIVSAAWCGQARDSKERDTPLIDVPCIDNTFEWCVTRNDCAGCSYGVQIEFLGYRPKNCHP